MRTELLTPPYPYLPYIDDDMVQAVMSGIGNYGQDYIDSFYALNLPIYTSKYSAMLDWVGENLYGIKRPVFPIGNILTIGEINNAAINELELNKLMTLYPDQFLIATDDVYKRVITWHYYKGDGDAFTIRTLKRRVMRFLTDTRVDQTYQVSVSFGLNNQVNITIYQSGRINLRPSGVINDGELNSFAINEQRTEQISLTKYELAEIFKIAVQIGCLEMPFQYQIVVNIV